MQKASQGARNLHDYLSEDNSEGDYMPSAEDEAQSDGSIKPFDDEDLDLDGLSGEQARQIVQDMVSYYAVIIHFLCTNAYNTGSRI